ncbi:MAG TPA: type VI secretion system baseplate subunit TssE [Verrucomicrobiae bacterium]|jgi:type VI secretion system protein ImpF|nr:type VI secretion system baseplate subunit TssE [Verrucomicrobiae bacterium]
MPEYDSNAPLRLPLLDRLLDDEPKIKSEAPMSRSTSLARLKTAVRRDLENLLNTRRTPDYIPEGSVEILRSVYYYGLPDITSMPANFLYEQTKLLQSIETAVKTFEARLDGVRVSLVPVAGQSRVLRFVIDGMLRIDPLPEHVVYDASIELTSLEVSISGDDRA